MLHNLFGSNRPVVLAFLVVPAICIGVLAHYFGTEPLIVLGGPVFQWVYNFLMPFPAVRIALGLCLIILNTGILNSIFNRHNFANKEQFLPAFVLFFFSVADLSWVFFNPVQLGVLLLLLSLRRLLTVYRVPNPTRMLFDAGLLMGIGALFLPLIVFLFPLLWLGLLQLRSFDLREWVVPFVGLTLPIIYAVIVFWWVDVFPAFDLFMIQDFGNIGFHSKNYDPAQYPFLVLTIAICMMGLVRFAYDMNVSTVHRKNSKAVFVWLSFLILIAVIYGSGIEVVNNGLWSILAAPVAVYSAIFFSVTRRQRVIQTLFYLWWISSIIHMLFTGVW